jgi:hypothetical protein
MDAGQLNISEIQPLLGYLNFSTGRPDPRFQAQFFKVWEAVASESSPWLALDQRLESALNELHSSGKTGFQEISQAKAVLDIGMRQLPPAYQRHQADLLFHQSESDLFQPGFWVRALEAVLAQQGPWDETERIVSGALKQLNDFVGHRPVAILENRPRGEPYPHEKLCPIALYLRRAGVAPGRYAALMDRAISLLQSVPGDLRTDAGFDFDHLDELALDPRAYDHHHPADKRPNYRFGEWDPHQIDNRGFYRRFVVRQNVLDGLLERVQSSKEGSAEELLQEAATVLAAMILMASGISGAGPESHDSSVSLATLMPRIARCRDTFYQQQLAAVLGDHGQRLRREASATHQPFGGARTYINQYFTRQRAAQLQQRHMAHIMAALGYPETARRHAGRIPIASLRFLADIHIHLTTCHILSERGEFSSAAQHLADAEDLLHRGIACGAMADPWNVLGFHGMFPLFTAREDSVSDPRIVNLIQIVERLFTLYALLRGGAAASGDEPLGMRLSSRMARLAAWWDGFATTTVSDVQHVLGHDATASADQMAETLNLWRRRGESVADLAFWRQHLERFRTPRAFGMVIDELLRKGDFRASMGLLVNWLAQAEQVRLQDAAHSFHELTLRWVLGVSQLSSAKVEGATDQGKSAELVRRFVDYLEANAEEYWQVPRLEQLEGSPTRSGPANEEEEELFGAAYEGVTYRDSTDDGNEGEVLGFEPRQEFDLERQGEALVDRLRFLSTVATVFYVGMHCLTGGSTHAVDDISREILEEWLERAQRNYRDLLALMEAIHEHPVPVPSGAYESVVEFDRRTEIKQRLLTIAIETGLQWAQAVGSLLGVLGRGSEAEPTSASGHPKRPRWEQPLLQLTRALWESNVSEARRLLPRFLEHFQHEPLLVTPLTQGGHPRLVLRTAIALALLKNLASSLPRLGLLRETYFLLQIAQTMESEQRLQGPRLSAFDQHFQVGIQASVLALIESLKTESTLNAAERAQTLGRLVQPFAGLWSRQMSTMRLSILETITSEPDWYALCDFVRKYGADLFHARFMTFGNLRGVLQRGVGAYLKYLEENPDAFNPAGALADGGSAVSLIDDLDKRIPRAQAERFLQIVLQTVIENYEEYKDYNNSTPLSDYGNNLHVLLDFLRTKIAYDRHALVLQPWALVHEVLVRHDSEVAALWRQQAEQQAAGAVAHFYERLADKEKKHGMFLRTVSDRVNERFVRPLELDRVCALIESAYDMARGEQPANSPKVLEEALQPFLDSPTGAGLDSPPWIKRLEAELHRVQLRRTAIGSMLENMFQVPRRILPTAELMDQLQDEKEPRTK